MNPAHQPRSLGGTLLVIGATLLFLLGLGCGSMPGLWMPLPPPAEPLRDHLVLLGVVLVECLVLAMVMLPALWARTRDQAFYEDQIAAPRGWTVGDAGVFFVRLTGQAGARAAQLVCSMGRTSPYQNPGQLRLYLSADAGRRLHLTTRGQGALLADLSLGLNILRLPDRSGLVGLALDADGARALLAWPDVAAAVRRLLDAPAGDATTLRVEPDAVVLTRMGASAHTWDAATLDAWLADLVVLAEGLETVGAPAPREAAWPAEHELQHAEHHRRLLGALSCMGCAGVLLLVYLGSAVVALAPTLTKMLR